MENSLDIFLLIGQSNMAGRGFLKDVPALDNPRILMFREESWIPAKEPLHTDKKTAGVGLGMSFATEALNAMPAGRKIGLLPCAVGGTPLKRWMPDADLYTRALSMAGQALSGGTLKAILWHQGEGDSHTPEDSGGYATKFKEMATALRAELNAENVPVITGELGPFLKDREGCVCFEEVNRQLRSLSGILKNYACVSSNGLSDNGDHLHFNAVSLREFGIRYARQYLTLSGN